MDQDIQSAYQEELERLQETTATIDAQLRSLQAVPRYYGPNVTEQILESMREQGRRRLVMAQTEPYFGRLDFQEAGSKDPVPLYVGKYGIDDETSGKPLVVDWRAPVASLFYSFTGGEDAASYESPDGLIEGLVYLKRNLVIRKQILQRVVDTYSRGSDNLGVSDEFLLYRLGENKDNRLRDIVSTIQSEQDQIIRAAKNTALVIQGVAGSGKTTVALHRLAYLLYQYRENVRAERMIIFAPNRMFLDYISGVLPELGVGDIQQTTFSDWVLERLNANIRLADETPLLEYWFAVGPSRPEINDQAPGRFKGAIAFKQLLKQALDEYEARSIPEGDFIPWEGAKLPAAAMKEWFDVDNKHYPLAKRRERVVARIKRWTDMKLEAIGHLPLKKERKKQAAQRLRSYLKHWPEPLAFHFYRDFFASGQSRAALPSPITEATLKRLKKKEVLPEDLAPLLYIHNRFHGVQGNELFDHIVIDEAQDFSPFQIAVLNEYSRGGSFTILGDLAQGIHAYRGIVSWEEFLSQFGEEQSAYYQLTRSYRSTMEIIGFANAVIAKSEIDTAPAVPVFRSGDAVRLIQTGAKGRLEAIKDAVGKLQEGETNTAAVITRTAQQCKEVYKALEAAGFGPKLIVPGQTEYKGGLSVLSVYLAKGLEFDAVLLTDVDEANYTSDSRDAKLLYVACTRALHRLWITFGEKASPLIDQHPAAL